MSAQDVVDEQKFSKSYATSLVELLSILLYSLSTWGAKEFGFGMISMQVVETLVEGICSLHYY